MIFGKKTIVEQKKHNLCLIIQIYACKTHHLAYIAAHYHNKNSEKISAKLVKDFSRKGGKCEKMH